MEVDEEDLPDPTHSDGINNSFWVVRVSSAVFSNDQDISLKPEFEAVFRVYDEAVQFNYLKSFRRVRVIYTTTEQALLAQDNLNNQVFEGDSLQLRPVKLAQDNLNNQVFEGDSLQLCPVKPILIGAPTLALPKRTQQFLISPPASPPVGWQQTEESSPVVDFSLVTALAQLQLPGVSQELHEGSATQPSIVVVTPEDVDEERLKPAVLRDQQVQAISSLPASVVHTPRPPIRN